ncbi:MAG TPA: SpoIIE family protein phosphatase [Acidimicrobiales bacterium]|nr:SpoIIE family protein phosphatase [Acidimicrobiales bacterium]
MSDTAGIAAAEVLEGLPMAVVLVDGTGRITGWNSAAGTLYGHTLAEVLGALALEVLFDEDDRDAAASLLEGLERGRPWEGDFRVRRSDGVLLVSSFRLASLGAAGAAWIATDGMDQGLAEQERSVLLSAERAARATAEEALGLVEAILSSAPVGIAVFDLQLRYVRVNDAYAVLSGVPASAHVGERLEDLVPLQADVAADLRRVATTGRPILGRHVELRDSPDVTGQRHFTVSFFPVRATGGALVGAGLTLVEITAAKRAEAERLVLLHRAEEAQQRLAVLATASTVLNTTMDLEELLTRLARVLTPLATDWCVIELIGGNGVVEQVAVSHRSRDRAEEVARFLRASPLPLAGEGSIAEVLRTGQAQLVPPSAVDQVLQRAARPNGPAPLPRPPIQSTIAAPIEARGRVLGVLILSTEGDRVFGDDDLDLAVEIAHRAALAVGNARAFQQERHIAESLQRALLPATVPSVEGLDLAVRYVSATDGASVGGDWYDVLAFHDGTTGIVVGDVIGHDITASTSMGQLRSALRVYAWEQHAKPAEALARVDRLIDGLGLSYATCIFGVLDLASLTFRWSNAGHPPPLLLRAGHARFLDDGNGVLLGVSAGSAVEEAVTELQEGDVLVLYTDGLVERRGESIEVGLERLAVAAAGAAGAHAEALCDLLLEALVPKSTTRDDDLAILVARVPADAPPREVHRLAFQPDPQSAALTRGFTAGVLQGAGWDERVDTAVLLVSELVTNAVRHARGPCALVVCLGEESVELSVEDGDPRYPSVRRPGPLDDHGRGLLLIGALADDWGIRALASGGKATWFVLGRGTASS